MYDFPDELLGLSMKRVEKILDLCVKERQDAALNVVVIGLKAMNHVHGYGLQRLSRLSNAWGDAIANFYRAGGSLYKPYPKAGLTHAGDPIADVNAEFFDLSDRKRRLITKYLVDQRRDAQWNAALIGYDTIQSELHFGESRMEQLTKQWESDIRCFYGDRDINEPRLKEWIEDVGFIFENGHLQSYRLKENNQIVKKSTMEKWLAEDIVDRGDM